MNCGIISGKWTQRRGQAQVQWGELTDDVFDVAGGDSKYLVGKLQEKYGWQRERAEKGISEFGKTLDCARPSPRPARYCGQRERLTGGPQSPPFFVSGDRAFSAAADRPRSRPGTPAACRNRAATTTTAVVAARPSRPAARECRSAAQ